MTEAELKEIEARAAAATPGPWRYLPMGDASGMGDCVLSADDTTIVQDDGGWTPPNIANDMLFFAAARVDVPALIAEVRRLNAENAKLKRALENAKKRMSLLS